MATLDLPDNPDLDQLRTQARELQRTVRAGDHAAAGAIGVPGPEFSLSSAQLVLARRYGFASWPRLKQHVEAINARSWLLDRTHDFRADGWSDADLVADVACLTYDHDSPGRAASAGQRLIETPELLDSSLLTAVVGGSVDTVRRVLTSDPGAAVRTLGPRGWSPLMYLAYSRANSPRDVVLDIASLLIDAGAEVNDGRFFGGFAIPFTVLTGVLGGGENDQPPHPHSMPLARLLLEHGAETNDAQALYNRMFRTEDDFLELLFEFGLGRGDGGPWRRLLPDLLTAPATLVHDLFEWAIKHDQRDRVALLLQHGADLNGPFDNDLSALDLALRNGPRHACRSVALGRRNIRPARTCRCLHRRSPRCRPGCPGRHAARDGRRRSTRTSRTARVGRVPRASGGPRSAGRVRVSTSMRSVAGTSPRSCPGRPRCTPRSRTTT